MNWHVDGHLNDPLHRDWKGNWHVDYIGHWHLYRDGACWLMHHQYPC